MAYDHATGSAVTHRISHRRVVTGWDIARSQIYLAEAGLALGGARGIGAG